MNRRRLTLIMGLLMLSLLLIGGCVRRTITITSTPPGALLWLNGREVGRTPVDVDFLYYGDYDVELVKDGFEPLLTHGEAKAPLWDIIPFDLVAEVLPGKRQVNIAWHYDLQARNDDPQQLHDRARALRGRLDDPGTATQPEASTASP